MLQVNVRLIGTIGIYCEGMNEVKKISKILVKKNLEKVEFENKEIQQELKYLSGLLPVIKTIGLSSRKEKRVDLYMATTSFGAKKPEFSIMGNYPLYNMLKKLIE